MKNKFFILIFVQLCLLTQVYASSRVDDLIQNDNETMLNMYFEKKADLRKAYNEIQDIEKHLRTTSKGQSIYIKLETIGGAVILAGIVVGSYKAHFPPGFRAMVSAYVSVWGIRRGLIKLNDTEVKKLLVEINLLYKKAGDFELALNKEMIKLCDKLGQQHFACQSL